MQRAKPVASIERLCIFCKVSSLQLTPINSNRAFTSASHRCNSSSAYPKHNDGPHSSISQLESLIAQQSRGSINRKESPKASVSSNLPSAKRDAVPTPPPLGKRDAWLNSNQLDSWLLENQDVQPKSGRSGLQRSRSREQLQGDKELFLRARDLQNTSTRSTNTHYGSQSFRHRHDEGSKTASRPWNDTRLSNHGRVGSSQPSIVRREVAGERSNAINQEMQWSRHVPWRSIGGRSEVQRPTELDLFRRPGSSDIHHQERGNPGTFSYDKPAARHSAPSAQIGKSSKDAAVRNKFDRLRERIEGRNRDKSSGRHADSHRASNARHRDRRREDEDDDIDRSEIMRKKAERKTEKQRLEREEEARLGPAHLRISLPPFISLGNLATLLRVRQLNLIQRIRRQQLLPNAEYNQILNADDAGLVALEYGFFPSTDKSAVDILPAPATQDMMSLPSRPPVVTIMGHVDHGKTTILDFLRKSSIAANEHGGITQHIGAFIVPLSTGKTITFLDTPGHAAFLSMRQRGANVTDIVVLVVAADDSVMPQTIEAIKHAKAAKVPIIVAVNKIDRAEANLDRVKQDLAANEIEIEDYGGDTQVIPVSGKTGQGMPELEESIITLSEILDHRAAQDGNVEGWIIEASVKNFGRAATILVRRGTLRAGDIVVAGRAWAKVKTLRNEFGDLINEAGPGTPVEVDGWRLPPNAGDEVLQATDEQHATAVMKTRDTLAEQLKIAEDIVSINASRKEQHEINETEAEADTVKAPWWKKKADPNHRDRLIEGTFVDRHKSDGVKEVCFVVKADVTGSVEAVVNLIAGLGNNEIRPKIIRSSAGSLNETDVDLAYSSGGFVLTFNTDVSSNVRSLAEELGVEIIEETVIYRIAENVNAKLSALLPPRVIQRVTGEAEIANTFEYKVKGSRFMIAGCRVRNGIVTKGSKVRVFRGSEQLYDGTLSTLKNVKKDVTEMRKDTECGMTFDTWENFAIGDTIQCYSETSEPRRL